MSKRVGGKEIIFDIGDSLMGPSHNRYMSAAATTWASATNSCTWANPGVSEIAVTVPTITSLTSVLVVIGAPNDSYVNSAFTAGQLTTTTSDIDTFVILPNTKKTFVLSNPVTRIDFLPIGAACPIWVEAN